MYRSRKFTVKSTFQSKLGARFVLFCFFSQAQIPSFDSCMGFGLQPDYRWLGRGETSMPYKRGSEVTGPAQKGWSFPFSLLPSGLEAHPCSLNLMAETGPS